MEEAKDVEEDEDVGEAKDVEVDEDVEEARTTGSTGGKQVIGSSGTVMSISFVGL